MGKHPAIRRNCDACTREWSAEAFLEPLDLLGTEATLDSVDEITIGSHPCQELAFDNMGGGNGDVEEGLCFMYNGFSGSRALEYLFL